MITAEPQPDAQPITHLPIPLPRPGPLDRTAANRLLEAFLARNSPETRRAYASDLREFAAFVQAISPEAAAANLLGQGHGNANLCALAYRAHLLDRKLAPATINRRLAAVRSLVQMANLFGLVAWRLEVEGVPLTAYKNTAGPGVAGVRQMINGCGKSRVIEIRNTAMMRLLADLALRRKEVVGMDVGDVDLVGGAVLVLGKGRTEKERLTLPPATKAAIAAWLAVRPGGPGASDTPLFVNMDRAAKGTGRLTGSGIYKVVRSIGRKSGLEVHPHSVRHSSITAALDAGLDLREVARYSRHRDIRTLMIYDDNRQDLAGAVAGKVADIFGE